MDTVNVLSFGAKGDGLSLDTSAIQSAIDHVADQGGGTVVIPGGHTFLCSGIRLRSYINLVLEPGSVLLASTKENDYADSRFSCVVEAVEAEDISITGFGRIVGMGSAFIQNDLLYIFEPKEWRPGMVCLLDCRRVLLRGFSILDSPWWTIHLIGCKDVGLDNLRIQNDLKMPNCDGIDPDHCQNVRISNCHIQCADDCIVFKNTSMYLDRGPCRDITVTGCTLMCTATAIKIGSESVDDFENITVTACTIKSSSRGFGIQLRDQGKVRNVIFSNCTIETRLFDDHYWGKAEPVHISALRRFPIGSPDLPSWNPDNRLGTVSNILCCNLLCQAENGIVLIGEQGEVADSYSLFSIRFSNVILNIRKWTRWVGGELDRRPMYGPLEGVASGIRDGNSDPAVSKQDFCGVFIENSRNVNLHGVVVVWGEDLPDYYGHALEARNAPDLHMEGFRGESPHPGKSPAISIT